MAGAVVVGGAEPLARGLLRPLAVLWEDEGEAIVTGLWLGGKEVGRRSIGLGGLAAGCPVRPRGVDPSEECGEACEEVGCGSGVFGLEGGSDVSLCWRALPLPDFLRSRRF